MICLQQKVGREVGHELSKSRKLLLVKSSVRYLCGVSGLYVWLIS